MCDITSLRTGMSSYKQKQIQLVCRPTTIPHNALRRKDFAIWAALSGYGHVPKWIASTIKCTSAIK